MCPRCIREVTRAWVPQETERKPCRTCVPKACQVLSFLDDFIETREPTGRSPGPLTCCPAVFSVLPWPSSPLAPACPSVESSLLSLPESSRPENTLSSLSDRPESLPSPRLGARAQRREGCKEHSVNDGRPHSPPLATHGPTAQCGQPPRPGHKPGQAVLMAHLCQQQDHRPRKGQLSPSISHCPLLRFVPIRSPPPTPARQPRPQSFEGTKARLSP